MAWICPNCKKEFRRRNQTHSCAQVDLLDHLRRKTPQVRKTFDTLMGELYKLGNITINPVKTSIQVKAGATFLSIRPRKRHLELEFQLGREVNEFPVYRTVRISKNRVLHSAILDGPLQVDAKLMNWLRESYALVKK